MTEPEDQLTKVESVDLPPEQVELIRRVRQVGAEVIGPLAQEVDTERRFPREAMTALHAAGLALLYVPKAAGGTGLDPATSILPQMLVQMELASWCSSTAQVYGSHCAVLRYIGLLGSDTLRDFFYNEALEGRFFASFGSEGNANKFAIKSGLERVGSHYKLNGRKHFATSSTGSSWAFWVCMTPDGQMIMPIVDLRAPGITVIDNWMGVGQRGTGSGVVEAKDVVVPADHVLTSDHPAYRIVLIENAVHLNFAAIYTGIAMGAYRTAISYVREKTKPWRGLDSAPRDPYLRLRVADMSVQINAARQLVIHAARIYEKFAENPAADSIAAVAVAQAKVMATQAAVEVTSEVFQVMGASSATTAYGFDRYFRDARTLTLHDPVDRRRELIGAMELGSERDLTETLLSEPQSKTYSESVSAISVDISMEIG